MTLSLTTSQNTKESIAELLSTFFSDQNDYVQSTITSLSAQIIGLNPKSEGSVLANILLNVKHDLNRIVSSGDVFMDVASFTPSNGTEISEHPYFGLDEHDKAIVAWLSGIMTCFEYEEGSESRSKLVEIMGKMSGMELVMKSKPVNSSKCKEAVFTSVSDDKDFTFTELLILSLALKD